MIVCTGRGTHDRAEAECDTHPVFDRMPFAGRYDLGSTRITKPFRQGREPAHVRFCCPVCGLAKRLGRRGQERLMRAEDVLGDVDMSLLPF